MGIRFACPNGHKLNVKDELAGRRALCPNCGARIVVPAADQGSRVASVSPAADSVGATSNLVFPSTALPPVSDAPAPGDDVAPAGTEAPVNSAPPLMVPLATPPVGARPPLRGGARGPARSVGSPSGTAEPAITDAPTDTAPVIQYLSHRRRRRQKQLTVAIVLLLAVIVLAIVLVWVVQRGPETITTPQGRIDLGGWARASSDAPDGYVRIWGVAGRSDPATRPFAKLAGHNDLQVRCES